MAQKDEGNGDGDGGDEEYAPILKAMYLAKRQSTIIAHESEEGTFTIRLESVDPDFFNDKNEVAGLDFSARRTANSMALRKREIINVIFEGKGQGTFVKARGDQITALVPWSPRAEKHIEHFTKFGSRRKQHSMSKQMWDLVGPRQTKFHTKDLEILTGETVDFWRGKNLHGAETRTRREQSEDKRAAQDDETLEGDHDGAAISRPDPLEKSVNPFGSKKESNKFAQDVEGEWTCTSCYQPDWTYFSRYQLSKDSNEGRQKVIRQARGSMAVHDFLELVVPEEMLEQLEKIDDSVWDVVEDARGFIDPTLPFWAGDSNWTPIVVA